MRKTITSIAGLISILAAGTLATPAAAERRPFTLFDAFNRTRLHYVDMAPTEQGNPFTFSSDGKRLFFITSTGNAAQRTYRFKLQMLNTDDIRRYLNSKSAPAPSPTVLLEMDYDRSLVNTTAVYNVGIRQLQLYDNNRKMLLVAVDRDGMPRLYALEIDSRRLRQLSNNDRPVVNYRLLNDGDTVVYTTNYFEPDDHHCRQPEYSLETLEFDQTLCTATGLSLKDIEHSKPTAGMVDPVQVNRLSISGRTPPAVIASGLRLFFDLADLRLSPDGEHAIIPTWEPEPRRTIGDEAPRDVWRSYVPPHPPRNFFWEVSPGLSRRLWRLSLLNIKHATHKPLYGVATDPYILKALTPQWLGKHQLLLTSATNEKGSPAQKMAGDRGGPDVIVDLKTGSVRPASASNYISSLKHDDTAVLSDREPTRFDGRCLANERTEVPVSDEKPGCYIEDKATNLRIYTGESPSTPPNILAQDLKSGDSKLIYVLNPQFKDIAMPKSQLIEWQDEEGDTWRGILILPHDHKRGQRYPLVIQTQGYTPHGFVVDGPGILTSPNAALPLAGKGMIVLQLASQPTVLRQRPPQPTGQWQGLRVFDMEVKQARGANSAIAMLDKHELIDTSLIGISGFSAFGQFAFDMAVWPKYDPQAIVVADAFAPTPFSYALSYQKPGLATLEIEHRACDSLPWGPAQSEWVRRNPYYHLDNVRAAVLFEAHNTWFPIWWDVYVGLRRLGRPVEFWHYATSQHPMVHAQSLLLSQQRIIEWFDFWLNGRESDDPAKAEQYQKWRQLRERKQAQLPWLRAKITPLSEMECPSPGTKLTG